MELRVYRRSSDLIHWLACGRRAQLWAQDVATVALQFWAIAFLLSEALIRQIISRRWNDSILALAAGEHLFINSEKIKKKLWSKNISQLGCRCLQWLQDEAVAVLLHWTIFTVSAEAMERCAWAVVKGSTWGVILGEIAMLQFLHLCWNWIRIESKFHYRIISQGTSESNELTSINSWSCWSRWLFVCARRQRWLIEPKLGWTLWASFEQMDNCDQHVHASLFSRCFGLGMLQPGTWASSDVHLTHALHVDIDGKRSSHIRLH